MDSKKGVGDGGWGTFLGEMASCFCCARAFACACHHRRENDRGPHNIRAGGSHLRLIAAVTFCLMCMQGRFHESERFSVGCQLGFSLGPSASFNL